MTTFHRSFITTAIPYVNARPHLGFAYELVLADILSRHRRQRGSDVRFLTGTDDNSLKNVLAAAREGVTTRELVDRNADVFAALPALLNLATDDFIRTSRDPRHQPAVEWLWRACAANGDLYRRAWHGRYCVGCEAFVEDEVTVCPEHHTEPEPVSEENWFFRLSRWREPVREAIESGRLQILPDAARAETLAFLGGEVRDLSVSRDAARSRGWGIPVPDDPGQVIYVWFDALVNYVSALGLAGDETLLERYWRNGERVHVIGKGISRFHAVYWPAFLLSAGLPLPDKIFVHGYLTVDGEKISKTGRSVEVEPVVATCGVDALRWYFARCCRTRTDGDVALGSIIDVYNRDLVDRLGNLVQRCTTLAAKLTGGRVPEPRASAESDALAACARALPARSDGALDRFAPDDACAAIIELLDAANRYVETTAPWRVARTDPASAAAALHAPLCAAKIAAEELAPIVPGVSATILDRLGELRPGAPLQVGPPPLLRSTSERPRTG